MKSHTVLLAVVLAAGCGGASIEPDGAALDAPVTPPCTERPTEGVWATFRMPPPNPSVDEEAYFRSLLTSPAGIASALEFWTHAHPSSIPNGMLLCRAPVGWNCGWNWHQDPATVEIVEVTIELCDGGVDNSDVGCEAFVASTGGWWCPWAAQLIELRDCRTDPSCPVVPR